MDIMKESDNDSESNHVLTYYKKYTQNPELCKYFTGPEASIKISTNPSLKKDVASINKASTSNDRLNTISDNTNITEVNQDEDTEHKNISPSSSIASIKKLEWDNGADIGYNNSYKCSTIKSASFPSLFVNDTSYLNEENYISKNIKQVRSMYHQLTFVPEPECCSFQTKSSTLKTQTVDTSSNEAISKVHSSLSSGSEKNKLYLQRRIGQPNAYSTPYDEVSSKGSFNDLYKETPVIRGQEKPKRNLNKNNSDGTSGNYIDSDKDVMLYKTIDNCCLSSEPVSIEKHQPSDRNKCNENPIQQVNNVQREVNLCLTKPIFVECIYSGNKYKMNKKSQKNSKSIQTESLQNNKKIIHYNSTKVCNPEIQKIEYVKYKNDELNCDMFLDEEISLELKQTEPYTEVTSEEGLCVVNDIKKSENGYKKKYLTTAAKMEDIQVITEKEYKEYQVQIDNESKSEYVHEKSENLEVVNPIKVSSFIGTNCSLSSQENSSGCSKFEKVLHQSESPVKENSPVTSNKSATDEMILAEMISLNQSRDLNTDIKRSINILQKLLNSKKYDEATKKYYIKKIVEKIVESKYSDDSTSSSEFFQPKKRNVVELSTQQKIGMPKNKSDKTMGSKIQLMQNIPWYPVHDTKYISKNNSNINCEVIKTDLYTDLKKGENTSPCFSKDDVDLVMDGKTSGDSENLNKLMVNSDCNVKHTVEIASSHRSVDHVVPKQPQLNDNTDQINNKNWKYIKTLSERLLENRDKIGQGDYLLKVATNERQHQLSWIKNEIKHLNKLKEMLERKLRPKTEMEGVISSLLKMHVDDVKGFSKNHNVFICSKCSTSKVQCKCDYSETPAGNQRMKKPANLVSGYYTIQTQLDRNGNLLDLTVYDEKGIKTYNYQHDGIADNVLITSKNRNTSIKLKPNAARQIGCMKSKECKCCGQLFSVPADKPEICCCLKCQNAHLLQNSTSSSDKNVAKHCKLQLQPKLLDKKPQSICTCKKCSSKSKQGDQDIIEAPTACQQSSSSSSFNYNIHFIKPKTDSKDVCNKYVEEILKSKCSCQKVTFMKQIALDKCTCRSEELLINANKNLDQRSSITESSTVMNTDTDKSEVTREPPNCDVCPRCRRKSLRCICFPRFLPKQPKLMGSVINGPKFIQKKLERVGTNRGRSTHFDSRLTSEHRPPPSRTISSSSDSKSETKFPPTKKIPVDVAVGKDTNVKQDERESNTGNSNAPSESPQSHLKELDAGTENLENQAKKVQCCRACKTCKSTSPRPILVQGNDNENNRGLSRTSPSRDNDADKNQPVKCHPQCQDLKLKKTKSSVKKGCQCCTCTDCGSQTKRFGDKNARCQCCVCENCGIQASLDGNNRKPILSKWCQPKQAKTQVQRTISQPYSEQPPYRTQIISNQFEVYSSHNQARTDFRNSPQASNMDISPHSAKWFHNQAHTGDAISVTQPNTKSQSKKCCCALDDCKCCQTSTHEAKNVQYSAFKQCLCQTESKEETSTGCSCKGRK
ncbi:hypothetical protein WA026_007228 [Henosepilachna vigintioctopunctata]|uniref:Uncharacterized protein n=1 Tax=Henosepilachna vigintioctopunctata TaxID=420089 RepID=A0AAW1VC32_9CUCU